jgi:Mn2+/Fe2+ NRAMP family transporter
MIAPNLSSLASLVVPSVPEGSAKFILSVIGGVGGSVTLLSYGYWIREKQWEGAEHHRHTQRDLGVAYILTGLFGAAMMIISAGVNPAIITGDSMALEVAQRIGNVIGPTGKWMFLLGFWGAVFTSLFGVWQSVPYFFVDSIASLKLRSPLRTSQFKIDSSRLYRGFLLYLAFPPMLLLLFGKPVWVIVVYSIVGALFMPFLAGTLLYLNNTRAWVGELKNHWLINTLLLLSLALFGYLAWTEIAEALR